MSLRNTVEFAHVPLGLVPKILNPVDVILLVSKEFGIVDPKVMEIRYVQHIVTAPAKGVFAIQLHAMARDGNIFFPIDLLHAVGHVSGVGPGKPRMGAGEIGIFFDGFLKQLPGNRIGLNRYLSHFGPTLIKQLPGIQIIRRFAAHPLLLGSGQFGFNAAN